MQIKQEAQEPKKRYLPPSISQQSFLRDITVDSGRLLAEGIPELAMSTKYLLITLHEVSLYRQRLEAEGIRVLVGYHATSRQNAHSIMRTGFVRTSKPSAWLGDGIYIWEEDLGRAVEWATQHFASDPAIIGIMLHQDIDHGVDLMVRRRVWQPLLEEAEKRVRRRYRRAGTALPRQSQGAHRWDREVFNDLADWSANNGKAVRYMREMFTEGKRMWRRAHAYRQSHIQIAIRDDTLIQAVWLLQTPEEIEAAEQLQ